MSKKIRTREIDIVTDGEYPLFGVMGRFIVVIDGFPVKGFNNKDEAKNYVEHIIDVNTNRSPTFNYVGLF